MATQAAAEHSARLDGLRRLVSSLERQHEALRRGDLASFRRGLEAAAALRSAVDRIPAGQGQPAQARALLERAVGLQRLIETQLLHRREELRTVLRRVVDARRALKGYHQGVARDEGRSPRCALRA